MTLCLKVSRLSVEGPEGTIVEPLDLEVFTDRMLAIIGESGSGKSMTAKALIGLLPREVFAQGSAEIVDFKYDLASSSTKIWQNVRGKRIVLLLQDPFTSLSPVMRCGDQIAATINARIKAKNESKVNVSEEVTRRLNEVQLSESVARMYPYELSGGMRQRVAIAAALAAEPNLLIADEPTTALDASTQAEVLDLLKNLQKSRGMGLILISHDLGVVSGRADDIMVMKNGVVVERGASDSVLASPKDDYTKKLIAANPSLLNSGLEVAPKPSSSALLKVSQISKSFGNKPALSDADVDVAKGEIVAIVGESGSGKSTLARCIAGLEVPESGVVTLQDTVLPAGRKGRTPDQIQIVFQDPYSTLNPSFKVGATLEEAISAAKHDRSSRATVEELLKMVDLDASFASRRPSQLSGGQRQRVSIARALAAKPQVLICDESVSALDVSVQAQILDLLARLRDELGLAMLFITHDLGVVARIASRVIVLQAGKVIESGTSAEILQSPQHEYTKMLVAAAEADSIKPIA